MTNNVGYSCDLHLDENAHALTILSSSSLILDRFQVNVDGENVFSGPASGLVPSGTANLHIDGTPIVLRWQWTRWRGPVYILLDRHGEILAQYGNDWESEILGYRVRPTNGSSPQRITQSRLIREEVSSEAVNEFASDEFPVDNRFGLDAVKIEQEVSKTLSITLTCEERELLKVGISATVVGVLKSQISTDLSRRLHLTIGEAVTKRHTVRFSVRAGDAVIYELKWKNKVRDGVYLASVDGKQVRVPYQICFGLTYKLTSSPANL